MDHADGCGEVEAAWAVALSGEPAVLRFSGSPAAALEPLAEHVVSTWRVGQVPEGPAKILWFAEGAASEAAADVVIAAVRMLQIPWLIIVSGPRAADRGLAWGLEVPRGRPGAVAPTRVEGLEVPGDPEEAEALVVWLAREGRVAEAAAALHALEELDPTRASRLRWVHVARGFYLARPDVVEVARAHMHAGPGQSRVLTLASQTTTDSSVSLHLVRQAELAADDADERADAVYYRNRAEVSAGQRAASDAGEPSHPLFLSMARFGPASREAYRNPEPGPAFARLEAIGTAASDALLGWVRLRYELETGDWLGAARGLLAVGLARSAGWLLAESIQYFPEHARLRAGITSVHAPRMVRAVELTRLLDTFDPDRARRLAPELLAPHNSTAMRCYGWVLRAAAAAVDGDASALADLHRSEIREQLQASFCTVLVAAADHAPDDLKARLLTVAADWAESIDSLSEAREGWLETLASFDPGRLPLGAYALDGELEAGGMGAVWLGEHVGLGASVAVKFIKRDAADHAEAFEDEVAVLARLDHPAVVQVLDVGRVSEATAVLSGGRLVPGTPYLVMEYVPGGTLTDYRGTLPWPDIRDLLLALLDALAYVHARGILHRDLKPQNVLVGESAAGLYVRLSDFGLSGDRMKGEVAGTPAYMAPEQFAGVGLGPWSDLYAVGCIATALLTGLPPFLGSANQLVRAHRSRRVPPLETPIEVPDRFEAWRLRLLAKAPEERFPNARAASLALRALPAVERELPDLPAGVPTESDSQTFVLETLVGIPVPDEPTLSPSRAGFTTVLPREGFAHRPLRPRLPTERLFGRSPSPCLGQLAARQAVWDAAVEAVRDEAIVELPLRVPIGMSVERILGWARRRLRELGLDVAADDRADMQLSTERPSRAPAVWIRESPEAAVSLHRLDPLQAVAQIRLQVEVTPALAQLLAARSHGLPELIDGLLAGVIRHPGLVPGEGGLHEAGPLPLRFDEERQCWEQVLEGLAPRCRTAVERASIAPPDVLEPEGVPADLLAGPVGARWLPDGLRQVCADGLLRCGEAEALHRAALQGATGFARGWHLLGVGDPVAAEPLLRAALPSAVAREALVRCLDLQLVAADDPRRPEVVQAEHAEGDGDGLGLLEQCLRAGQLEDWGRLAARALAERAGEPGMEWEILAATNPVSWDEETVERSRSRAAAAGRGTRPDDGVA